MQAEAFYTGNGVDSGWNQMKIPNWLVYFLSEIALKAYRVPIGYLHQNLRAIPILDIKFNIILVLKENHFKICFISKKFQ